MESPDGGRGPQRLAATISGGMLDPELAALAWLLVEANVPAVVAAPSIPEADGLRQALLELSAPGTEVVELAGEDESFGWMPEAEELGWRADRAQRGGPGTVDRDVSGAPRRRAPTVMVADLDPGPSERVGDPRPATWGEQALVAIRALSIGYGMLATMRGDRLEDLLSRLAARPVGAMDDELTRLGLVLILAHADDGQTRVVAAHYLRPVSRDAEGHIHRFAPAVLATWDPRMARFEHFAWAITDELAGRAGITAAELEREQARRASVLSVMTATTG